jgi:acyl carrier protein
MDIHEFIKKIEAEFEDLEPGKLKPNSEFRKDFDFTSVNALIMISLINVEFDVVINADDLRVSKTVQDLFNIIKKKMKK